MEIKRIKGKNNMKFIYDIDSVVREIHKPIEEKFNFKIKHWSYIYKGKDFWDMINTMPEIWLNASPTEYYPIIKEQKDLEFWTVQREENKESTINWLNKHFPKYKVKFFKDFEHKYKAVQKNNVILIDDFPNFPSYESIVLIDRNYNKNTHAKIRVTTPKKLQIVLDKYL